MNFGIDMYLYTIAKSALVNAKVKMKSMISSMKVEMLGCADSDSSPEPPNRMDREWNKQQKDKTAINCKEKKTVDKEFKVLLFGLVFDAQMYWVCAQLDKDTRRTDDKQIDATEWQTYYSRL